MAFIFEVYSIRHTRSALPSRYTLTFGFFATLVVSIGLFFLSTMFRLSNYDLFMLLLFLAMLFILLSGIFAISGLLAWIVDVSASRSRARLIHTNHRIKGRRQRWLRREQGDIEPLQPGRPENNDSLNGELDEWIEDADRPLPNWLIPLLQNRPAALAIHDDLRASGQTRAEIESQLQSRIDELEPGLVVISYADSNDTESGTSLKSEIDKSAQGTDTLPISETEIEKEAILNLLGALELQRLEKRVTEGFYQRKRKQLTRLLSKVNKQLEKNHKH